MQKIYVFLLIQRRVDKDLFLFMACTLEGSKNNGVVYCKLKWVIIYHGICELIANQLCCLSCIIIQI